MTNLGNEEVNEDEGVVNIATPAVNLVETMAQHLKTESERKDEGLK